MAKDGTTQEPNEAAPELLARDLLPPDDPPPDDTPRKIAERRVVGWAMSAFLSARRDRRPVGNSARFWKKIEDDDPFLPPPESARMKELKGSFYPSERLQRMPEPKQKPKAQERPPPRPKPQREAPPQQRPEPRMEHTPDPQQAPAPQARRPPPPPPDEAPVRRMPPRAPNPKVPKRRANTGRIRVGPNRPEPSSAAGAPEPDAVVYGRGGRSSRDIREEKERWRAEAKKDVPPPKLRGLDDVISLLGDLKAAEDLFNQGVTGDTDTDVVETRPPPRPPPKPKPPPQQPPARDTSRAAQIRAEKAARREQGTGPKPPPKLRGQDDVMALMGDLQAAEDLYNQGVTGPSDTDVAEPVRTPPKPKPAPVNRSPSGKQSGGGMDDLFGGATEGRVRIGKRTKKAPKPE